MHPGRIAANTRGFGYREWLDYPGEESLQCTELRGGAYQSPHLAAARGGPIPIVPRLGANAERMMGEFDPKTLAIRAGIERSQHGEHSEALYLTSSFVFHDAAQAAARFASQEPGNIYARFSNPTVSMFQERLAAMEGAERCVATASGMAAIHCCIMGLLSAVIT